MGTFQQAINNSNVPRDSGATNDSLKYDTGTLGTNQVNVILLNTPNLLRSRSENN